MKTLDTVTPMKGSKADWDAASAAEGEIGTRRFSPFVF